MKMRDGKTKDEVEKYERRKERQKKALCPDTQWKKSSSNVPVVVGVAGVLAVIAGVILYLNKRWCLTGINSLNCCDETWGIRLAPRPRKTDLGRGFSFEEAGSSSDSDEDGRRRRLEAELQVTGPSASGSHGHGGALGPGGGQPAGRTEFAFHRQLQAHYGQTTHIQIPSRSGSIGNAGMAGHGLGGRHFSYPYPEPGPHGAHGPPGPHDPHGPHTYPPHTDLMSMAERGCLGLAASSNGSTSSGSTSCSEEDKMLRHREGRGHHQHHTPVVNFAGGNASTSIWPGYPPRYAHRKMEPPLEVVPEPTRDQCGSQDCIVMMNQEDGAASDIQSVQSAGTAGSAGGRLAAAARSAGGGAAAAPICACGQLEVAFAYDAPMRNMTIHLLQARDIPAKDRGGSTHTQVRLLLLPAKKQKCKSKVRHGDQPQFMESFLLNRINPEDVNSMGVRFRLYGCERMRRERLIGECVVSFAAINLEAETNVWLNLEPRANTALKTSASDLLSLARSDSTGSSQSMQHGGVPELLLGLAYNGTTGRLSVELVKGSHFRNLAMTRAPDTFVRLRLASSSGQEIARAKSSLPDVTLLVSVYNKRSMKKKEAIGWFALGAKSSGEEEAAHWNDMCEVRGEQICRWHVLLDA
ncbi:hypothetical protein FOCC_FOCC003977 [Frankliniella occidentalis]|nr:hypothetical protein FOCC_FOCC003977 [Frankliniella occidentalis]